MLYNFIKIWVRLALIFFCRKITFTDPAVLKTRGPLLLACNHPNSFLDAIIIGSHFKQPVHFLARGDAFRNPLVHKLLMALKMIPIYRLSEGREYLALNDATFEKCQEIFRAGGIVLIFAEGLCVNQWALRPLKKGAARIAWTAFNDPAIKDNFRVIPVGINYNGFGQPGKRVIIDFEKTITANQFEQTNNAAGFIQQFNDLLYASLNRAILTGARDSNAVVPFLVSNSKIRSGKTIIENLKKNQQLIYDKCQPLAVTDLIQPGLTATTTFQFVFNTAGYIVLLLPAITGWLGHVVFFYPLNKVVKKRTKGTVFYDSVMFGILMLAYPLYWILLNSTSIVFVKSHLISCIIFLLPVFARMYLTWLDCATSIGNYLLLPRPFRKALAKIIRS